MAYTVVWSPRAIDDVEAIAAYIAEDSEAYAASVVRVILAKARTLSEFPFIGRVVPEFDNENIREVFAYSYRIIYEISGNEVAVATVVHGSRMLELAVKPWHAARDDEIAAEWAFHDYILGVKTQVKAQFGESSNEIQALGLKKKSEYKSPSKKQTP